MFTKMRMTGPRSAQALLAAKQDEMMRSVDPTLNELDDAVHEMKDALDMGIATLHENNNKKKRTRFKQLLANGPSISLARYNLGLKRLQTLKSRFDDSYAPLVEVLGNVVKTMAPTTSATPTAPAAPTAPVAPVAHQLC